MYKNVVIRLRIELDRDFYERAKKRGYKLRDIKCAIEQAGLEELSILIDTHDESEELRRLAHNGNHA